MQRRLVLFAMCRPLGNQCHSGWRSMNTARSKWSASNCSNEEASIGSSVIGEMDLQRKTRNSQKCWAEIRFSSRRILEDWESPALFLLIPVCYSFNPSTAGNLASWPKFEHDVERVRHPPNTLTQRRGRSSVASALPFSQEGRKHQLYDTKLGTHF